jgi:flagellin
MDGDQMIIQHNLLALNTNNNMKKVNKRRSKSMEKLSSGFRINQAADDAAGLTISEKMRSQIRGLEQGTG